jgi:diguanylate cyclase (GGDEF)-like protein
VLVAVTGALRHHMRAEDHLGRLGGEEFLAVLPDSDHEAAAAAAERMRGEVAATAIEHEGVPLGVTVSLGVATWAPDEPPELLLRRADDALYAAKGAGRDLVVSARASVPRRT